MKHLQAIAERHYQRDAARLKHLPLHDREALCGAQLVPRPASPGADPCVVCLDLARRGWVSR